MEIIDAKIKRNTSNWMVDISGEYAYAIQQYLSSSIPSEGIANIMNTSAKIVGYCPNPKSKEDKLVTGLLIGKVQSGKTSTFIGTIATAFDNGYDIAVVLAGTKKELLSQNKDRINEYFEDTDVVILEAEKNKDELTVDKIRNFIELGKKIIIVTLKHPKWIEELSTGIFCDRFINTQPIIMVDDEGDEYTLNNEVNKDDMSANYAAITGLRNICKKAAYLSVTATPQANIIINTMDVLSPDFAVLIKPGKGYCGLDTFHNKDSKYCVTIPEEEKSLLDGAGIPTSFYKALSSFFIASHVYHSRKGKNSKFSMLIHPSRIINDLTYVSSVTNEIIDCWRNLISNRDDIAFSNLRNRLLLSYNEYKNSGVEMEDFELILDDVLRQIRDCGIHLITGGHGVEGKDKSYANNIYIGGDMVGRGLTFKGLTITYIIRSAKGIANVDTVQQRARWFGYKEDYLDLCRVYATEKIISNFENIRVHEEDLWQTIAAYNLDGSNFKDMKRFFVVSDDLRPTRKSIGKTTEYTFNLWTIENTFIDKQDYQRYNMELVRKFASKYVDITVIDKYGKTENKAIRGLSYKEVYDELISKFRFPSDGRIDMSFFNTLNAAVELNLNSIDDARCDLVWPRYNSKGGCQDIKILSSGKIQNFMVGHGKIYEESESYYYPGDREIMRGDVIEIQFHNIRKPNNDTSLSMAVYIPPKYAKGNYVTTNY